MNEPSKWAFDAAKKFYCGSDATPLRDIVQQAIDAALAEKDKRIAELEAEVKGWSDANKAQSPVHLRVVTELQLARQRLASLQALVERKMPHTHSSYGIPEYREGCPRCAFERWLQENK